MKKEKIITIGLCLILIVVVIRTIGSAVSVKEKLELKGDNQWTMEAVVDTSEEEEVQEEDSESDEVPKEAEIVEEQIPEEEPSTEEPSTETPVEGEGTPANNENPEAPVLTLESDTVTIAAGADFDVISQVDEITDNKDDPNELFRHIRIGGDYDVNTPGEYTLEYIVTDLDGNDSASKMLTLIVEG